MQKIRDHFGKAVIINSAYRTASHNSKVGGSPKSQHVQGKAADIRINGADPLLVAQYAESIGLGGIGLYDTFTHVDTRATKSKWDYRNGQKAVTSFGGQGQFKE
ncbi:MAG: D-Ala-D-Ala carboxypeptidase family metallohydrolase, partial [Clostridiales bacterium]